MGWGMFGIKGFLGGLACRVDSLLTASYLFSSSLIFISAFLTVIAT